MCGEPLPSHRHVVGDPRTFAPRRGRSVDPIADARPRSMDERVVDDGHAQWFRDAVAIGRSHRRLKVRAVEEVVLRVAHDRVVSGGAQQVVQTVIAVERRVAGFDRRQRGSQPSPESRTGVAAVPLQQRVQVAGAKRRLRSAERQMSAVAGDDGHLPVVPEHLPGLEQIDDGLDRVHLRRRQAHDRPRIDGSVR